MKNKRVINKIVGCINNIYKKYNSSNCDNFKLIWLDNKNSKFRILGMKLIYTYPDNKQLNLISKIIEIPLKESFKDNEELFYDTCLNELIRYMLFAKDNDNLVNSYNEPIVIKSIQTLIKEKKNEQNKSTNKESK
jgi:hypothetical protein